MTAQLLDIRFRRFPGRLGPIPVWRSPARPLSTTQALRELDEVPRCDRCETDSDRRACRALALKRDGMDWLAVAREVGYPNGKMARKKALAHLESELT